MWERLLRRIPAIPAIGGRHTELLLAGGLATWAIAVYLLTSRGLPEALLEAVGIDRGHPVLWQVAHSLFWGSLAFAAFRVWKHQITDKPNSNRWLGAMAFLAGFFQVALLMLAGLALGFGNSPYSHEILPMAANILYVLVILVAVEMSRACLVAAIGKRSTTLALVSATILFAFVTLPLARLTGIDGPESLITMVGERGLPALSEGLLASFLALTGGPLGAIAYRGVLEAFEWLSPILPNLAWPVTAFIGTLAPILGLWIIQQSMTKPDGAEEPHAASGKATIRRGRFGWLSVGAIAVTMLWLVTGMFGIQPFIISGPSMLPTLEAGDMVVVREVRPESIEVGDIIRFYQGEISVIHRVVEIEDGGGQVVFVTRGDNNNVDDDPVLAQNVDGKVVLEIPKLGWPSILLRRLIGGAA